jgi:ligand-binding SRPBCC domain-containing protein
VAARLHFEDWVSFPLERVFLFFANPRNLARIMPPASGTRISHLKLVMPPPHPSGELEETTNLAGVSTEIHTSFRFLPPLPFRATWITLITEFEWNHHFADIQSKGPFRRWRHRHEFDEEVRTGVNGTLVRDIIDYEAGFGFVGALAEKLFLSSRIQRTFAHRQQILSQLLETPF